LICVKCAVALRGNLDFVSFSRIIGVVPGALAFLAVALLVFLPVCSALDAHAAVIPANDANSCCVIVEGAPIKAPSAATGDRSGHSDIEHRSSGAFFLSGPSGPQALGVGFAPRARSYYARSARILR
jgi:hypothetical protein